MAAKGTCAECGKENTQIIGKGLCWKCRQEAIAAGTYDTVPPKPQEEPTKPVKEEPPHATSGEKTSGLDALLEQAGHTLDIPYALLHRMEQADIWPADVILLIEMLLDGRLRRVV